MYKFFLFSCGILYLFCKTEANLVNKNVERVIDLSTQLVKITTYITLENTGKEPAKTFQLALEPETAKNLSYLHVTNKQEEELKVLPSRAPGNQVGTFFDVELKSSISPGGSLVVNVEAVFTQSLTPYPHSITQKDKQLVRYFGNHYFYSPYLTIKQIANVALNSRSVENYSKLKPVSHSDSVINYGPYNDIPPYSEDEMIVHFESNAPFLAVTHLERLIDVSHWGSIAVQENVDILHTGAKLKGPFSRYDYQRDTSNSHHSIKSYKTILPATADSIYYRDSNGNISTSQVRARKDWIELELRPRYPLFGGWKSSYTLGYSVPSYQYVFRTEDNQFALKMRLIDHVFDDMHVAEMETSIVLPVGVSDVKVTTPYPVERLPDTYTFKYLDTRGRIIIRLRKTNLVEHHIQDFTITYSWKSANLLYEPVVLSLALFLLFLVVVLYVRLDFSIIKAEHQKKE